MLTYEINRLLLSFLNTAVGQQYLGEVLVELSGFYQVVSDSVASTTRIINRDENADTIYKETRNFDGTINSIMQKIKEIQSRKVFNEINKLEIACDDYSSSASNDISLLELKSRLKIFSSEYDEYLNGISFEDKRLALLSLIKSASLLLLSLNTTIDTFKTIISLLSKASTPTKTGELSGKLSILIESEMDLERFLNKLNAINVIYVELCTLVGVSYNQYPIAISKIESGSLWAEILGYPKVIALLESIIENSISYMYRTFTREGKIASIPRKVEIIESILDLRKKLKAVGIDTTELDSHLQKASVIIAQEANQLLVGEPKVVINEKYFTIGAELEKKYLEAGRTLLLPKIQ